MYALVRKCGLNVFQEKCVGMGMLHSCYWTSKVPNKDDGLLTLQPGPFGTGELWR